MKITITQIDQTAWITVNEGKVVAVNFPNTTAQIEEYVKLDK